MVIDLRNNPGGVVDAAARIADDFLDSGLIVTAEGRTPDARFRIEAHPGDISEGASISLIVNAARPRQPRSWPQHCMIIIVRA